MDFPNAVDQGVFHWFQAQRTPVLDPVVLNFTDLGHRYLLAVVALVAAVGFLIARRFRAVLLVLMAAVLGFVLSEVIKSAVERPRPEGAQRIKTPSVYAHYVLSNLPQLPKEPYSFPSSHALIGAAVYGSVALLLARRRRLWLQALVLGGAALLVLLIGASRLYLGAHWLSDVLAGLVIGGAVALLCGWLDGLGRAPPATARPAEGPT